MGSSVTSFPSCSSSRSSFSSTSSVTFLSPAGLGVKVLTFSLGFGPELAGFNDRHGTRWKISAVPLGGYVKFFGDESEASTPSSEALASMTEEEREGSFHHKKVGPRAAIVAAGPIANFLLAIVIFAGMSLYFGKPSSIRARRRRPAR